MSSGLLSDPDIGWHIRAGQLILDAHAISGTDPFTSTMGGKPWFNWEWGYDLIVGALDRTAGLNGVTWFAAVIVIGVFCCVFRGLIAQGTHILVALVLTLLAVAASAIHLLARPHIVSWLFALLYFWILDSTEIESSARTQARRLWLLPAMMVLWVNLHGGFPIGLIMIGIYGLASIVTTIQAVEGRPLRRLALGLSNPRTRQLAWVGLACAIASLINPYGWKLHVHIYGYLSNVFFTNHIDEMQSPNFHQFPQQCFLALILIFIAVLALGARRVRTSQLLMGLFAIYSGLYAARSLPTSAMLLAMITGPMLPSARLRFFREMAAMELQQRGHFWPLVAIVVTGCIAASGGRLGERQVMNAHFDSQKVPAAAVDYIAKETVPSPILSLDTWGGYLTYRLFPRSRVVLDDRHSLFGEEMIRAYLRMLDVEPDWEQFLNRSAPALIVLPRKSALAAMLGKTPAWRCIYQDEVSIVFEPVQPK